MDGTGTKLAPEPDGLLAGIPEVRRLLGGVSRRTVLRLLDDGELRRVRIRGRTMTPVADVLALIERQTEGGRRVPVA